MALMDRGIVAEAEEGDRVGSLASEVEPVEDTQGPIPAPECPDSVNGGIVEGGLEVGQPVLVGTCQISNSLPR
jgi:hypothetical protein